MFFARILSHRGQPLDARPPIVFPPKGGTIGRSPDCTLVLPDPTRHVSRVHARLEVADDGPRIVCLSAGLPLSLNGRELGDREWAIVSPGDRVVIGEYELELGLADTISAPVDIGVEPARRCSEGELLSPLPDEAPHPFDLKDPDPVPGSLHGLPDPVELPPDHPLAAPLPPAEKPSGSAGIAGFGSVADGLGRQRADSIDALFGLDPATSGSGLPGAIPFAPLGIERHRRPATPPPDPTPEVYGTFRLPEPVLPSDFGKPDEAPLPEGTTVNAEPSDSADQDAPIMWPTELHALTEKVVQERSEWEPAPRTSATAFISRSNAEQRAALDAQMQDLSLRGGERPASSASASDDGQFELLKALVLGLGLTELPRGKGAGASAPRALTPELMRRVGELTRIAADGTVELLRSRATVKREMGAEPTMVHTRGNNPLKFAPDGLSALEQLLSPHPVRGFMDAIPAMQDAYDDLQAHQVAFVAGMRAALQGLLEMFDPSVLQQRLARRSVIDAMVPTARRARLWELFVEKYDVVSREAQEDFDSLFTREFVRAYDEQMQRIRSLREGTER